MAGLEKLVSEISDTKAETAGEFNSIKPETKLTSSELTDLIHKEFEQARIEERSISREDICNISDDDIDIDVDMSERMLDLLERFEPDNWAELSETEKYDAVTALVKEISKELGLKEEPFVFFIDREDGYCGSYAFGVNTIVLNKNGFNDPRELVDTIAHELRHAYQYMRAEDPITLEDHLFRANFENYISPEYNRNGECINFKDYYSQYVEADARAYAKAYTDAME